MIARCTNPRNVEWHRYGGRGITVYARWRGPGGFARFVEHVGPRPETPDPNRLRSEWSLDRIDNAQGYRPGNVRWNTMKGQARNSRRNVWLTLAGRAQLLTDWADELGIERRTLKTRLKRGWSVKRTLTTPIAASEATR